MGSDQMTLIVFGDSIAYGLNDPLGGYVRRAFDAMFPVDEMHVFINLARPNHTSKNVLQSFKKAKASGLIKDVPGVVLLFAFGINDAAYDHKLEVRRTKIEVFQEHVEDLIRMTHFKHAKRCFVGLSAVDETLTKPFSKRYSYEKDIINRYEDRLRKECQAHHILFCDGINDDYDGIRSTIPLIDGLHPSPEGHQLMAIRLIPCLKQII